MLFEIIILNAQQLIYLVKIESTMTNHRCRQHGMMSNSQCDNILYSGLRCSNSVCLECTDFYESVNDTKKYCYDCVISYRKCKHEPITRVIPNSQSVPMK